MMAAAALAALLTITPAAPVQHASQIPVSQQAFAACVGQRESHDNYRARRLESGSSAAGRFQFLDAQWRQGLAYMVAGRLQHFGMSHAQADRIRKQLQSAAINHWPAWAQDAAFAAALNGRGPWTGWRHWFLQGSKCNRLVPRWAR